MKYSAIVIIAIGLLLASCQDDEDSCEDLTCLNGGACVDGICDCPPGYLGINCQNFEPCDTIVCLNEAPCVFGVCACPPGYSGDNCENFDPCFDVVCENDGSCVDGTCQCPPNFIGDNCEIQVTPTSIAITAIQVTDFPLTRENGELWDQDSNPDIFPGISKDAIIIYTASSVSANADPAGVYAWTPSSGIVLTDFTESYEIILYDEDPDGESEEMGLVVFTPYSSQNDFPETMELSGNSISFTIQLAYTW